MTEPALFQEVIGFHGHRCLDIAMGYRVALAAMDAMEGLGIGPKDMVAVTGNDTCAVDAIQAVTGCTYGKRNLVPHLTGKPAYAFQHMKTGKGVRIYVHYWEGFDTSGTFRKRMGEWKRGKLDARAAADFEAEQEAVMAEILHTMPEALFKIEEIDAPPPPKSGGFTAVPCAKCGEHVKGGMLEGGVCVECAGK